MEKSKKRASNPRTGKSFLKAAILRPFQTAGRLRTWQSNAGMVNLLDVMARIPEPEGNRPQVC